MTETKYIHVIMPVGSDSNWTQRRAAIQRAVSGHGIDVRFPNYLPLAPAFKIADLKRELAGAEFVLADLTYERPSCYYELGIAEALGLQVRLVAERATPIHQSAARNEVEYYATLDELEAIVGRSIAQFAPIPAKASP